MIDLYTSEGYFTQTRRVLDLLSKGNTEELANFELSPLNHPYWSPYFLPFEDEVYAINFAKTHTYIILEETGEFTWAQALWEHELPTRKKAPRTHEEPCFLCMPGLTVWSNRWVASDPDQCAWYIGIKIMSDDNFLESRGVPLYPLGVQNALLPPSAVANLVG